MFENRKTGICRKNYLRLPPPPKNFWGIIMIFILAGCVTNAEMAKQVYKQENCHVVYNRVGDMGWNCDRADLDWNIFLLHYKPEWDLK